MTRRFWSWRLVEHEGRLKGWRLAADAVQRASELLHVELELGEAQIYAADSFSAIDQDHWLFICAVERWHFGGLATGRCVFNDGVRAFRCVIRRICKVLDASTS
jgi:hypothetical protein